MKVRVARDTRDTGTPVVKCFSHSDETEIIKTTTLSLIMFCVHYTTAQHHGELHLCKCSPFYSPSHIFLRFTNLTLCSFQYAYSCPTPTWLVQI